MNEDGILPAGQPKHRPTRKRRVVRNVLLAASVAIGVVGVRNAGVSAEQIEVQGVGTTPDITVESTPTSLTVSWSAVDSADRYRIRHRVDQQTWSPLTYRVSPGSITIPDLLPGRTYTVAVSARIDGIWGTRWTQATLRLPTSAVEPTPTSAPTTTMHEGPVDDSPTTTMHDGLAHPPGHGEGGWVTMASEGPLTVPGTATPTRYAITPAWEPGRLGFLNTCQSVGFAQVDPIVAPGQPMSAHMHEFFGNPAITEHSTTAQIAATPRSSIKCHDQNDLAAYWSPAVYQDGVRIRARLFRAYYKGFSQTQEIQPMPVGLRMVAGNAHATSNQSAVIGWWEQTRSDSFTSIEDLANTRDSDTMIRVGSKQRISLRINYPSCWDGIHLDSPDHQSHVAYTVRGRCPATHPVPIPQLVTFTQYVTPGGEGLRLASGPWYTFHQDFWNAWDEDQMTNLIERCIYTESNCRTGAGPQLQELGQTSTWIPLRS